MIITTDLALTIANKEIVLIKRAKEPFKNKLALPGGHLEDSDATLKACCLREAKEEINYTGNEKITFPLTFLNRPGRDPRSNRCVSNVFHTNVNSIDDVSDCVAGSDAKSIHIVNLNDLSKEDLAFDHWEVIKKLKSLQQ